MRNLQTPIYDPILPDSETRKLLDFWTIELEKLGAEHILQWAFDTFGSELAFAPSWNEEDGVVCSLLERVSCRPSLVETIYPLLHPEKWAPLIPKESKDKTFDGRAASAAIWARFRIEHLCKRNENTIRRYRAWIVPTIREDAPTLTQMPILSWIERFGVLRIAPLARWKKHCIHEKLSRETVPCDLYLNRESGFDIKTLMQWPSELLYEHPSTESEQSLASVEH